MADIIDIRQAELERFDFEQNTPEWFACRIGIPTASEFGKLLAKGRDGKSDSKTRRKYVLQTAGERMTGELAEQTWTNRHVERGKIMEEEARSRYAFLYDAEPQRVGFLRRGRAGASPDSLIGEDGLLEIKTKLPDLQLEVLLRGVCPPDHYDQVQGQLLISGRKWCDFVSYWPKMPLFCVRVERDEQYIDTLCEAITKFNEDVDKTIAQAQAAGVRTLLAQAA